MTSLGPLEPTLRSLRRSSVAADRGEVELLQMNLPTAADVELNPCCGCEFSGFGGQRWQGGVWLGGLEFDLVLASAEGGSWQNWIITHLQLPKVMGKP